MALTSLSCLRVSSIAPTFSNILRSLLAYRPDATGLAYESHLVAWKPQSFWSSLAYKALVEELDSKLPSRMLAAGYQALPLRQLQFKARC